MAKFQKGKSGNPRGRPKGALSLSRLDVQAFWDRLLNDRKYWPQLRRRFNAGKAQHLEVYLWQMKHGKAPSKIEITRKDDRSPLMSDAVKYMTKSDRIMLFTLLKRARSAMQAANVVEIVDGQMVNVTPSRNALPQAVMDPKGSPRFQSATSEAQS